MKTWNIGNTTIRNPQRTYEILKLFIDKMKGRPFRLPEQLEFQVELIKSKLIDSERISGADSGRKFPSAFKQLGFISDWSRGKAWSLTPVGASYLTHPEIEDTIFLRQLLKYQIPSPLEKRGTEGFNLRPFRLLLRLLKRAHDEGLVGLTKFELGLFVITVLTEDEGEFEKAIKQIKSFRKEYEKRIGKVAKNRFAHEMIKKVAARIGLEPGTLLDYADSNGRYALMSGLLTLKGNKATISEARLPLINAILSDGTQLVAQEEYLPYFYDPLQPQLPTDSLDFLKLETTDLWNKLTTISSEIGEPILVSPMYVGMTLLELQAHERQLRSELIRLREIQFYKNQSSAIALTEIEDWLENIRDGNLVGGETYAPAFFEWAIWRLFLAINEIVCAVGETRGFKVDEDIRPIHHAKGGAADLTFTYSDFKLVCEMTLMSGSQQFAREGEPVTRHVYKAIEESKGVPVYGLFVTRKLDPNTIDAFHRARYWKNWKNSIQTPVIAFEIEQILKLVKRMREAPIGIKNLRKIFDEILDLQATNENGPSWFEAYSTLYNDWANKGT